MLKVLIAGGHENVCPGIRQFLLNEYRAAFIDEAMIPPRLYRVIAFILKYLFLPEKKMYAPDCG